MGRPNLVIVVLDTVRAKNLSCYGYPRETTPYLDELCSKADLFKNAFTPGIWTIASHASLFTGTYPSRHGALNLHRHLDSRYITLAEVLSSTGYQTMAFSENGFISMKEFGLSRGFKEVEGFNYPKSKIKKIIYKAKKFVIGCNDTGAYVTNQFVKRWLKRKESRQPFFMFLNYMEAHAPYIHIQKRYLNRYLSKAEKGEFKNINQDRQKFLTRSGIITEQQFDTLRSVYDAQISYLDFRVKELIDILKSRNIYDNSIVIITSDHGDLIGEHDLVHHSYSVYEELIHVPLIVKLPGNLRNGKVHDSLVSLLDIFPTIVDLLEIKNDVLKNQLQGANLFSNGSPEDRDYIFVECERPKNEFSETYPNFDFSIFDRQILAIRSNRYKFIWGSDGRHELFDIEKDPCEKRNVINELPLLASQLKERLFDWYNSFEKVSIGECGEEVTTNEEIKERLRALGYF